MAKRKAKRKAKRNRKEPARRKARLQATGLYSLPAHLIEEILLWIKPTDEDQSVWQWVCRMSATCTAFRHVICSARQGVTPLRPTVLELDSLVTYWGQDRTVQLMKTIRRSDWMGAKVQSVQTGGFIESEDFVAAVHEFMSLMTTSGKLPNLAELHLSREHICPPILPERKTFLRDLARAHPSLTTLSLTNYVLGLNFDDYLSPRVFATLASSLPNLERFEMSSVHWLQSNHLVAFFSNVGSKLTYLLLEDFNDLDVTDKVFASIAVHCNNLVTFRVTECNIPPRQFESILRSNGNISHVDICHCHCDNPRLMFDSIAEHVPGLHSFKVDFCDWVDDEGIRTLINGQINAFGRSLLTELGITDTEVTADGLRSVLTQWRESSHVPLQINLSRSSYINNPDNEFNALVDEFSAVSFWL